MAHITSQSAVNAESPRSVPSSDSSSSCSSTLDLEDGDNSASKEGTRSVVCSGAGFDDKSSGASGSDSVSNITSSSSCMAEEKPVQEHDATIELRDNASSGSGSLEDTSCGVKKKIKSRKENKANRDKHGSSGDSRQRRTIKAGTNEYLAVSSEQAQQEEGGAAHNLANSMEQVSPDFDGRSGSPYPSSENDWEASDHSDTDADHSDSSDDDNPTSQVDRMIECGARLIMDDENSNLSSETDDTDDDLFDSDSDITEVSPLMSNNASPIGLSPVLSRRSLPSSISKPPFMRHYNHHGHDGDVEDEEDDDLKQHHSFDDENNYNNWTSEGLHDYGQENTQSSHDADSANLSLVVQALLKIELDKARKNSTDNENIEPRNQNNNFPRVASRKHTQMSSAIHANPHHRHLRKSGHRRKNMSFTNEEVRIINRDNAIMLDKLLAVNSRPNKTHSDSSRNRQLSKPSSAAVNRKRQEEAISKDNLMILRRLQESKPSRNVAASTATRNSNRHSHHHHHHHSHHHHSGHHQKYHHHSHSSPSPATAASTARSCSATARQLAFTPPHHHHHHHHSPKETAL